MDILKANIVDLAFDKNNINIQVVDMNKTLLWINKLGLFRFYLFFRYIIHIYRYAISIIVFMGIAAETNQNIELCLSVHHTFP